MRARRGVGSFCQSGREVSGVIPASGADPASPLAGQPAFTWREDSGSLAGPSPRQGGWTVAVYSRRGASCSGTAVSGVAARRAVAGGAGGHRRRALFRGWRRGHRRDPGRPAAGWRGRHLSAFDVLAVGDHEVMAEPWTDRRKRLEDLFPAGVTDARVQLVPRFEDAARLWRVWVLEWGGEGIVLKDRRRRPPSPAMELGGHSRGGLPTHPPDSRRIGQLDPA
jgi:ATP dependent DNA ligase domain